MKKSIEALNVAIEKAIMFDRYRKGKPGAVIESLPADKRKALLMLTSDDTRNMWPHWLLVDKK